jgi:uncharacterized membrane protein YdfJ with MMPL/SSD domain
MVAVFGSFVLSNSPAVQQMGFALAIALALDATLVRLVLVPALMRLFGQWNWWLPGVSLTTSPTKGGAVVGDQTSSVRSVGIPQSDTRPPGR